MSKFPRKLLALFIIIIAVIGFSAYVNNQTSSTNLKQLNKKFQEDEKRRSDSILNTTKGQTQLSNNSSEGYKVINKLFVPMNYEDWSVHAEINNPDIDLHYTVLACKKDESMISISSQNLHRYITGLDSLSKYYNEKFVRNLAASGLTLKSKFSFDDKFKDIDAKYEFYDATYEATGEVDTCIAINTVFLDKIYTIFFLDTPHSQKIIKGIYFDKKR